MVKANIHRRQSFEQAYPPDAFASDAVENGRTATGLLKGVRILFAPDAAGDFDFVRTTRQAGEAGSAAFVAPYRREDRLVNAGRDSPTTESAGPDPREGYEAFIAEVVTAAQKFGFRPEDTPGHDEPRLRGLRQ
jgi:hypothetical protein